MIANFIRTVAQRVDTAPLPDVAADPGRLNDFFNYVIGLIAIVSVLMVVIGGVNYILSSGDPAKANRAKNTIIYALVGLIIAMSAYALVAFVIGAA